VKRSQQSTPSPDPVGDRDQSSRDHGRIIQHRIPPRRLPQAQEILDPGETGLRTVADQVRGEMDEERLAIETVHDRIVQAP
jgi:hypothetical protein